MPNMLPVVREPVNRHSTENMLNFFKFLSAQTSFVALVHISSNSK